MQGDLVFDLKQLFHIIKSRIITFIIVGVLASLGSYFYVKSLPNVYTSEALLSPVASDSNSGLGALSGQIGGLASIAGINLGSMTNNNAELALKVLTSRDFIVEFISENEIAPHVFASQGWDLETNSPKFDEGLYNATRNEWVRAPKFPRGAEPSKFELHEKFLKEMLKVEHDALTGFVTISISYYSPELAQSWLDSLIKALNEAIKTKDVSESKKNIQFLNKQLENTELASNKSILFELIEEQTKTLMFANVRDEYVFEVIDKPFLPTIKAKPSRAIIMIGFVVAVLFLTLCLELVREAVKRK